MSVSLFHDIHLTRLEGNLYLALKHRPHDRHELAELLYGKTRWLRVGEVSKVAHSLRVKLLDTRERLVVDYDSKPCVYYIRPANTHGADDRSDWHWRRR